MGVLKDFERRLEGAVDGFFARLFRSGLQPIELAKAVQGYARDFQTVSHDGVVVPNVYRFTVNEKDLERLRGLGVDLPRELGEVVVGTARERGWMLRGPALVRVRGGDVPVGEYDIEGRIESVDPPVTAKDRAPSAPAGPPPADRPKRSGDGPATSVMPVGGGGAGNGEHTSGTPVVSVRSGGPPTTIELTGRTVAGRAASCEITLNDSTVSREHAAFVRRAAGWWVVDLGSMNGTKVNGRPAGEHELSDDDTIELGEAVLEYREH